MRDSTCIRKNVMRVASKLFLLNVESWLYSLCVFEQIAPIASGIPTIFKLLIAAAIGSLNKVGIPTSARDQLNLAGGGAAPHCESDINSPVARPADGNLAGRMWRQRPKWWRVTHTRVWRGRHEPWSTEQGVFTISPQAPNDPSLGFFDSIPSLIG